MAPVERRGKRLVAAGRQAVGCGEHAKAIAQPVAHGVDAHERNTRRRHLDGQRDAFERIADRARRVEPRCIQREAAVDRARAPLEERDPGVGIERPQPVRVLGRNLQRHLRRREHCDGRRALEQRVHQARDFADHVLAVVEHEQEVERAKSGRELRRRIALAELHAGRIRNRRGDARGDGHRCKVHPPRAVRTRADLAARHVERDARLADAAGSNDRHQAMTVQQVVDRLDVGVAPDQRFHCFGEVRARERRNDRRCFLRHRGVLARSQREAVTPSGNRGDRSRAQRFAQCADVHLEVVLLDGGLGPHDVHELRLRHQPLAAFDQRDEHVERARPERGVLAVHEQAAFLRTDLEAIESQRRLGRPGAAEHAKRRKFRRKRRIDQLVHMLGTRQVLEPLHAHVAQRNLVREHVAQELAGRARHEHLAAVACREQACDAVQRRPEVIPVAKVGVARVERHAHRDGDGRGPWLRDQRALRRSCGRERIGRAGECGAERIADRLEDVSVVRGDHFAHQRVVTGECDPHLRGKAVPQAGAAVDVREQERHGPARKRAHARAPCQVPQNVW